MEKNRLNNFLIDDVKNLLEFINNNETVQEIATPGTQFDTLGDFASYWNRHINKLSE